MSLLPQKYMSWQEPVSQAYWSTTHMGQALEACQVWASGITVSSESTWQGYQATMWQKVRPGHRSSCTLMEGANNEQRSEQDTVSHKYIITIYWVSPYTGMCKRQKIVNCSRLPTNQADGIHYVNGLLACTLWSATCFVFPRPVLVGMWVFIKTNEWIKWQDVTIFHLNNMTEQNLYQVKMINYNLWC